MKTFSKKYCFVALLLVFLSVNITDGVYSNLDEGQTIIKYVESGLSDHNIINCSIYNMNYDKLKIADSNTKNILILTFYPEQSFALRKEIIRTDQRFSSYLQI